MCVIQEWVGWMEAGLAAGPVVSQARDLEGSAELPCPFYRCPLFHYRAMNVSF